MNVFEFADLIRKDLIIKRHSNQNNRFTCQFECSETKNNEHSAILHGAYGNGDTPEKTIADYVNEIKGKLLVFNALHPTDRQEFQVPQDLSC